MTPTAAATAGSTTRKAGKGEKVGAPGSTAVSGADDEVSHLEEAFTAVGRAFIELMSARVHGAYGQSLTGELDRTSYFLLGILREQGPARVTELAQSMKLDVSTVSRTVQQLDEAGFVDKKRDEQDGRAHLVVLAAQGADLLERTCQAKRELLAQATKDWSHRDRASLASHMSRLASSLSKLEGEDRV